MIDDLFTHGFDGSGGDNYFDAGSCIDGRLTSAWNCKSFCIDLYPCLMCCDYIGCSLIEKKKYFPIFLMTVSF
jgi:hypothetical protein